MSHTPGPWKVSTTFIEGGQFPGIYREDAVAQWGKPAIAHAIDDDPNWEANAKLIAAAPDLLKALQFYADLENHEVFPDEANAIGIDSGELAREAIRKAIGD